MNSARPMTNVFNKAHSTIRRPINNKTSTKNSNFNKRVNTVSGMNVNTARPKAVLNAVKGNQVNAVKASACWVWKPKTKVIDHVLNTTVHQPFRKATKDETSGILKSFITGVENLIDQRVKVIRCDNGTEFKNKEMNQFYERKGKFDGKADEGFFVGDSINSKAFRSMNYKSVVARNQSNGNTGTKAYNDTGKARIETEIMKRSTNNANTASDENKTNNVNAVSSTINAASIEVNAVGTKISIELSDDPNMPELEDIVYLDDDENVGAEADMNNLNTFMPASLILTTRIHKDHLVEQIIRDLNSAPQTRRMINNLKEHEGIDYDEVFTPVARIKAIRLFLAYASFKDFMVYQMDVKSAFLYSKIEKEVYVCQSPRFEDLDFPNRVYKVEKALYGLHQALRAWYFSFGRHLDELHMTWAYLEKKWMRLRTNTKTLEDLCSQILETASQAIHDAVTTHQVTTSQFS
ncbi:retrovirus-related pol polyprotein from transposon TNT 1-94 [Tanacetum coccineum]